MTEPNCARKFNPGLDRPDKSAAVGNITLRDYQVDVIAKVREAYLKHRSVLMVMPTGAGKTTCFAYIVKSSLGKGRRVLVLAHRRELVIQASRTFDRFGIPHGLIMPGELRTSDPVQIGMVQTVANRLAKLDPFSFIIVDEAHHTVAGQYRKILTAWPDAKVLGPTATPERLDGKGLADCYDAMVIGPTMKELIAKGALSKFRLLSTDIGIDLSDVRTVAGDYNARQLAAAVDRQMITGCAVEHFREEGGRKAIAFCVSVEHAEHVAQEFREAGIDAVCVHGGMESAIRDRVLGDFAAGRVRVLTSCNLISEGFDVPDADTAILLRPTKSLTIYLQAVGRVLRPAPGKERAVILDHVRAYYEHGSPDRDREWSLAGRPKRKSKAGQRDELDEADDGSGRKVRKIEVGDGRLVEVNATWFDWVKSAPIGHVVEKCEAPDQIKLIGKIRGYRPGWAIHQIATRFRMTKWQAGQRLGYSAYYLRKLGVAP